MNKKGFFVVAMLLALAMIFNVATVFATESEFKDINKHWAKEEILKWQGYGVIKGYDNLFRPDDKITRADFAVIIDRLMKYQAKSDEKFEDLLEGKYYTDAILGLNKAGVMLGYEDSIRPLDNITREEAIVMIARAFNIGELDEIDNSFSDEKEVSSWALKILNNMKAKGYVVGKGDNKIYAKDEITRAEAIKLIDNMVALYVNEDEEYEGDVNGIVLVNAKGAKLKNMKITGTLLVADGIEDGKVELENVEVEGDIIIHNKREDAVKVITDDSLEVEAQDFGTVMTPAYQGISVGFTIGDYSIEDVRGMKVELYAGDELIATNTAKMDFWKELDLVSGQCSTPFVIKEGTFKMADDEAWTYSEMKADSKKEATRAVITVKDKFGAAHIAETKNELSETAGTAWEDLFEKQDLIALNMGDFETHRDLDYHGLDISFDIGSSDVQLIKSMKVTLYSDDNVLAVNEGKMENLLEDDDGMFDTTFLVNDGTFKAAQDTNWSHSEYIAKKGTLPTDVIVIVTDIFGTEYEVSSEVLDEADPAWVELFETPELIDLNAENFNTHKSSDYIGINAGFNIGESNVEYIDSITATLYGTNGEEDAEEVILATNEAVMSKMKEITGGKFSTPFIIKEGSYTRKGEEYWKLGAFNASEDIVPSRIVIKVIDMFGREYEVENESLSTAIVSYEDLFETPEILDVEAENFNLNIGGDYVGINVGYNIGAGSNINLVSAMKVELYNGEKLIATNEAVMSKMKEITSGKFSTPFIVKEGTYKKASDAYWKSGEIAETTEITKAVIIVTDIYGKEYKITNENLTGGEYADLFEKNEIFTLTAENFNTHKNADYTGLNVGYNIGDGNNINYVASMKVELYSDDKLLATNEAIMSKMKEITSGKFSAPFIMKEGTYTKAGEECWKLGEYTATKGTLPTKAVITLVDIYGTEYKVENDNLQKINPTWDSLFETEVK